MHIYINNLYVIHNAICTVVGENGDAVLRVGQAGAVCRVLDNSLTPVGCVAVDRQPDLTICIDGSVARPRGRGELCPGLEQQGDWVPRRSTPLKRQHRAIERSCESPTEMHGRSWPDLGGSAAPVGGVVEPRHGKRVAAARAGACPVLRDVDIAG